MEHPVIDASRVEPPGGCTPPMVIRLPSPRRVILAGRGVPLGVVFLLAATAAAMPVPEAPVTRARGPVSVTVLSDDRSDPGLTPTAEGRDQRWRIVVPLPTAAGGAATARVAAVPVAAPDPGLVSVPSVLWAAYRSAVQSAPASCHLDVTLLAAIGEVESGSLRGRSVDAGHRVVPPVLGPRLTGGPFAMIRDTDGGRWDQDPIWDRAVGPMQFIPSTWARYGRDGDGDGIADPQNVDDSAVSAAGYLCGQGRDLSRGADLRAAILSYNHSQTYLQAVLALMGRVSPQDTSVVTIALAAPSAAGPRLPPVATPPSATATTMPASVTATVPPSVTSTVTSSVTSTVTSPPASAPSPTNSTSPTTSTTSTTSTPTTSTTSTTSTPTTTTPTTTTPTTTTPTTPTTTTPTTTTPATTSTASCTPSATTSPTSSPDAPTAADATTADPTTSGPTASPAQTTSPTSATPVASCLAP
jgi:Transglycosylase SLT domain